ncbi:hypothetical protein Vretifemale_2990 [Volvox reticuliferus]|uniref:Uncharacterized protein n=1 Tax=Volvox reticuliferus TaxID=1737510 RepID=A0A8J4C150_9CHLO|nr:hypothetical protein Vretifemale_2990 [Volvox reticuliferus]
MVIYCYDKSQSLTLGSLAARLIPLCCTTDTQTGVAIDCPLPGVPVPGIPVVNVPMSVALVETPLQTHISYNNGNGGGGAGNAGREGNNRNGGCNSGSSRAIGRVDDSGCTWRMAGVGTSDREATGAAEEQFLGRHSGPPVEEDAYPETSGRIATSWRSAPPPWALPLPPPPAAFTHPDAAMGNASMAVTSSQDQPTNLRCNIASDGDGGGQPQAQSEAWQEAHQEAVVVMQHGGSGGTLSARLRVGPA